jgi:hypothetical protein
MLDKFGVLGCELLQQPIKVRSGNDGIRANAYHLNPSEMKSRGIAPVLDVSFPSGFVVSSYAVVYRPDFPDANRSSDDWIKT